jgi:predicted DNA-binding transcriptional regulator AlpA
MPQSASSSTSTTHRKQPYIPSDPLLTTREAAAETGRSFSTFRAHVADGRLPPATLHVGNSPRWRRSVLLASMGLS